MAISCTVYLYICTYLVMGVYLYVCTYFYMRIHTYIHMYIFAHLHFTAKLEIMNTKKNVDDDCKALS